MSAEKPNFDPYEEPFGEIPGPVPVEVSLIETTARLPEELAKHIDASDPQINGYFENGNSVGLSLSRARRARVFVAKHPRLIAGATVGIVGSAAGLIFLQKQKEKE